LYCWNIFFSTIASATSPDNAYFCSMAKVKTLFSCSSCGVTSPKWIGNCPSCGEWNTYQEEISMPSTSIESRQNWKTDSPSNAIVPVLLGDVQTGKMVRLPSGDMEFDRVLGGGIVPGSLILIGGQPGIGKSTLLLQVAMKLRGKIVYVSGEENEEQIRHRADRLGPINSDCYLLTETNTQRLFQHVQNIQPQLLIIDSIQTIASPHLDAMPGSISQVRECTAELQRFAKETNTPVVIIGHITKDGSIAGPKLLEHIVDTVLQFEGDRQHAYRILRTLKNRFGSTDELGIYEMQGGGLREVSNPSELLLSHREDLLSGSCVSATLEGMRPILIETQALVSSAIFGTPQRSSTGFDTKRLHMLLAVLEKRCGIFFGQKDVFLNMAGGIKVTDPAVDLSIVSALISSLHDVPVSHDVCFAGEVGLNGEVRTVSRIEQRIQEADRLGFQHIFLSKNNLKGIKLDRYSIVIHPISRITELAESLFA